MDIKKLIHFFKDKLAQLPAMRELHDPENSRFVAWWSEVMATGEEMGDAYMHRVMRIEFLPAIVSEGGDNSEEFAQAYQRGMDEAEALMRATIEGLENLQRKAEAAKRSPKHAHEVVSPYVALSDEQVKQVTQAMRLDRYDGQTQRTVTRLLEELKNGGKNKDAIVDAVTWLAEQQPDALVAFLLAASHAA
jgi:hypothetical protein